MLDDSDIDVAALRRDTPSCGSVLHANNAGASPSPEPVHRAVVAHLELERRIGGYAAQAEAAADEAAFYTQTAALLGAAPDEIAFAENATRAWDMAFYAQPLRPGDRVLTHAAEYVSNVLALLQLRRSRGIEIDFAPSDETGQIDVQALERMIGPRTRLIALTHAPTQGGLLNPAEEVGRIARAHGVPYLLDACQSAGQIALDVERIGCDMLSGTGRKFLRGPRGTGFLYVRRAFANTLEPPFVDLRAADWDRADGYTLAPGARRFETWESAVAGKIGLAHAIRYARGVGLDRIERRIAALAAALREGLAASPRVTVHDQGARKSGIVTFLRMDEAPEATAARLGRRRIMVSVSPRGYARLDFEARGIESLVRASLHAFNTEAEVEAIVKAVSEND